MPTNDHPDTVSDDELPLGFPVIMRRVIWPSGDGVVHNAEDPCGNAPSRFARSDLATTPSEGKELCSICEWPAHAKEALEHGN